ncbi:MAG: nickel/cobalt exporter [Sulfurimonas sp.]|jgi:nickel/cobalt exporter|uniref:HoxN/HupN/NixA family nickel/cobalt transporter n=1 Tax=Sulfurimonas sp. TaxID=2022749 RepID=UPI0039E43D28
MESLSFLIIFWYGVLHAFGPDHLSVIANFSLAKSKKKTFLITVFFALGHGLMLFIFAKILQSIDIPQSVTNYGDLISAAVIIGMGIYLLYMVVTEQIQVREHFHDNKKHTHIYFGKEHEHDKKINTSVFVMGGLMGIGGVRGMLVTLSAVQNAQVTLLMVLMFSLGVMLVFVSFGVLMSYLNRYLSTNIRHMRGAFAIAGISSIIIGTSVLF